MLGKTSGTFPLVALAMLFIACAHDVPQDSHTGEDGKTKGAKPINMENGEGKAKGVVTYPGGDGIDWKMVEVPEGKRGTLDFKLTWLPPRPGLQSRSTCSTNGTPRSSSRRAPARSAAARARARPRSKREGQVLHSHLRGRSRRCRHVQADRRVQGASAGPDLRSEQARHRRSAEARGAARRHRRVRRIELRRQEPAMQERVPQVRRASRLASVCRSVPDAADNRHPVVLGHHAVSGAAGPPRQGVHRVALAAVPRQAQPRSGQPELSAQSRSAVRPHREEPDLRKAPPRSRSARVPIRASRTRAGPPRCCAAIRAKPRSRAATSPSCASRNRRRSAPSSSRPISWPRTRASSSTPRRGDRVNPGQDPFVGKVIDGPPPSAKSRRSAASSGVQISSTSSASSWTTPSARKAIEAASATKKRAS